MATKFYKFTGKCKWAKVYPGQEDEKYGHFGINFYPANVEEFKATGVQLKPRQDDDGTFFVLRRQPVKLIKGKLAELGAPVVLDSGNNAFNQPIGNGSTVTVEIAVYDTQKGKGHRLEKVRVDELVVYEKPNSPEGNTPKIPF